MAIQTVNLGTAPTGAGGDTFRSGSAKLQANDNEIYNYLGDGTNLNKLGTAAFKNTGTQVGNVMEVGAFGLGGGVPPGFPNTFSEQKIVKTGFYYTPGTDNAFADGQMIFLNRGYWLNAITFPVGVAAPRLASSNTGRSDWSINEFMVKGINTWVDGNGFVKSASPIVKLFADKIELNDEAQLQEITFEKSGVGDYLIKGSSGFAQDGWYIETPKDANGNVLFSVIYTTLENGDISVKTYKKKFDFETVSIVVDLDSPVDITENRWIDLRLQELPQPEIEIPESIAPPEFQPTGLAQAVATVMESYHDPEQ